MKLIRHHFSPKALPRVKYQRKFLSSSCLAENYDPIDVTCYGYNCFDFYGSALQNCVINKSLSKGKSIHAALIKSGLDSDSFLINNLLNLYGKSGSVNDARQVFDTMKDKNAVSWTTMVSAYAQNGHTEKSWEVFSAMHSEGIEINEFTFGAVLRACPGIGDKALSVCRQIHGLVMKLGFGNDVFCCSALVDVLSKCGRMSDAWQVFDNMVHRNIVSWNAMISGYVQNAEYETALQLFSGMVSSSMTPNSFTLATVLKACASLMAEQLGMQLHVLVIKLQNVSDAFVATSLIDLYMKCRNPQDAMKVFDDLPHRDGVLWSGMIAGLVRNNHAEHALRLFCQIHSSSLKLDHFTLASAASACTLLYSLVQGTQIHAHALKSGTVSEIFIGTALVDMYAKFGLMEDAQNSFADISQHATVSWNVMISCFVQNEYPVEALLLVIRMLQDGWLPNQFTFSNAVKACTVLENMRIGPCLHAQAIKVGLYSDAVVGSTLIDMYVKCGSIKDATLVFESIERHDTVSWTAMIAGYAQCEYCEESLRMVHEMHFLGMKPNAVTTVIALKACAGLGGPVQGKQLHAYSLKFGFESEGFVGSALVDMYGKCGDIGDAERVFYGLADKDIVSWSAIIGGYAQHGHSAKALELFCNMHNLMIRADQFTFATILSAAASLSALEQGKSIHALIVKKGFDSDVFVESALVDMYSKSGIIEESQKIFERMSVRSLVSWSAMIAGYSQHGQAKKALDIFEQMKMAGVEPDDYAFVGVLTACSRGGLVDEGNSYFNSMSEKHGLKPQSEHYACMVDLLGRAGKLCEAEELIRKMPFEPSALVWRTLLGSCLTHGNLDLGKRAAEWVLKLDPTHSATYVLLSNIYAREENWLEVRRVRRLMEQKGLRKEPGTSWIEIKNNWHPFTAEDRLHPEQRFSIPFQ